MSGWPFLGPAEWMGQVMKVDGNGSLRGTRPTSSARGRPGGATFSAAVGGSEASSSGIRGTTATGGVSALFALQSVDDPTVGRRRAVLKGQHLLDALDEVRLGLLTGGLSPETLRQLSGWVEERLDDSGDPELQTVLAEIELRAKVELAKLERSSNTM